MNYIYYVINSITYYVIDNTIKKIKNNTLIGNIKKHLGCSNRN